MPRGVKRARDGRFIFVGFDPANIKPDEVATLDTIETVVENMRMHAPTLARNLAFVQRFLVELRSAYHNRASIPSPSIPATSFESAKEAAGAVEVIYNARSEEHQWYLRESDYLSDGVLSPWAGKVL
jgi:hypothetical protein